MLKNLGEERWKYYLNDCLPGDEIILTKIVDSNIVGCWISLVKEFKLKQIDLTNPIIRKLIDASKTGNENMTSSIAESLYDKLVNK